MMTNLLFSQATAIGKRFAMVLTMLLIIGVTQAWGETATYTLDSSNNGGSVTTGDVSWAIDSEAIAVQSNNCKLTGTITVTLPTGATLNKVSIAKSNTWGSGATVTFKTGSTTLNTFSNSGDYTLTTNKDKLTYTFTKSGTSSKNAWVKSITVDYTIVSSGGGNTGDDNTGSESDCDVWKLVTDASELKVGDEIVIAAANADVAMSKNANTNNNENKADEEITKSGNTIIINSFVQTITLENGTKNETFAFNTGSSYLYAASSSSNHLKTKNTLDDNGSWSISITSEGIATIKAQGSNTRNWLRYNGSSSLFSCYASGQADVSIYKYVECGSTQPTTSTYLVKHCKEGLEVGTYPEELIEIDTLEGTVGKQVTPSRKPYAGFTTPDGQTVEIEANNATIVTYKYTRMSYTLKWVLDGGKVTTAGTAASIGATGTISQSVRYGTSITAPVVERDDYEFDKWDSSVSKTMPASDKTFTAQWTRVYTINLNSVQNGTISTNKTTAAAGETVTLTATPHDGYRFGLWTVKDAIGNTIAMEVSNSNTFKMPESNVTVSATFNKPILSFVTQPASPIVFDEVQCGSNTPKANAKQVEVKGENLVGNVSVEVTGPYKIAKTDADIKDYTTTLELESTQNGAINANYDLIRIISCPPAGKSDPTTGTLTFTTKNGNTLTVNLSTPTVNCAEYTIKWMVNGVVHASQTALRGTEINVPENPSNDICDGKKFVGWTTTRINEPQDEAPAFVSEFGTITSDQTYYAVFATEGGGEPTTEEIYTNEGTIEPSNDITTNGNVNTSQNNGNPAPCFGLTSATHKTITISNINTSGYNSVTLSFDHKIGSYSSTYPTLTINCGNWTKTIKGSNNQYTTVSYNDFPIGTNLELTLTISAASGTYYSQTYLDNIKLIGTKSGSTTYLGYITNCTQVPDPTWVDATITHTAIKANCGSTTVLGAAGENGPATISFGGTDLQNSVTVTASDGFLVSTDKTTANKYTTEVTVNPHKDGQNIGTIQNVYVIANAPAQSGNYTGTITLTGNDITNGSQVINVTAAVTCTQYTITWSVSGDTEIIEPTTFYAGGDWELPENPNVECEGREFVGWTTNPIIGTQDNEPNPLCSTKADFQDIEINDNITFYAVFATEGGGTGDWQKVTTTGDVKDGETYLIISFDGTYYLPNAQATSNPPKTKTATKQNGNITVTDEMKWIATASDGGFTFTSYSNNEYYLWGGNANDATRIKDISNTKNATKVWFVENHTTYGVVIYHNASEDGTKYLSTNGSSDWRNYVNNTLSNNNRAANLYKYSNSGSSSGYSNYATSCASIKGIRIEGQTTTFNQHTRFDFGGTVYAIDQNDNEIDVTSLATFSGYDMSQTGTQTVTVTYQHFTVTYEITINEVDAWTVTWNVSGATNTGIGPRHVVKGTSIGDCSSTGDIQIPDVPTGEYCEDKVFVGWTDSNTVPADGGGIDFINKNTPPNSDITYYAVFAESNGGGSGNYEKVTASLTDYSGEYLIVYETDALAFNGGSTTLDAARNTITVTIDNNTIEATDATNAAKFTIAKTQDGYTIKSANGYYIGQTSNANGLLASTSTAHINTISIADGNANIISSSVAYLRYNATSGQERFRYFKSDTYTNQKPIALYKKSDGIATYTNYTTGCHDCIISYYGFKGGYTTSCDGDLNHFTQRVNSAHTIPNCGTITDPLGLNREFLNLWNTQPNGGKEFEPGTTFILTQDTTFYAQWALNTSGNITLPTDVEDLANTDIVVTGGNTLTLGAGTTTIKSLTLKGGIQADGSYKMPIIYIPDNATLKRKSDIIYLDLVVNAKNYYPFAVPFRAKNGSAKANWDYVGYIDPVLKEAATYRTHFVIKTYDGAKRADNGENRDANWAIVNRDTYLEPGVGYMITAMTYAGKDTVTMRIPMRVSDDWFAGGEKTTINEVTRNAISVTAHTGAAATEHQRHAGWNFVANPYLSKFAGTNASNEGGSFINGEILIQPGFDYGGDNVPYVTIPAYDFSYYEQVKLSDVTLSPEYSFFVQIGKDGTMSFTTAGRQQAPAHLAARAAEQPIKMDVDITLSDDNHSDQTGLIICDRFSDAYEIGHDLEKMFGSAYNLSVYTLMADNTPLAFQALAIQNSMQVIPVGYRTPAQGEYTFALNEATSDIELLNEQYEQLILVDYETGALTNMLNNEYTFYSDRTQSNNRFALYAVPRQNTTTDLPNAIDNEEVKKVIYNDHFYILRDGKVFNGAGQIVK